MTKINLKKIRTAMGAMLIAVCLDGSAQARGVMVPPADTYFSTAVDAGARFQIIRIPLAGDNTIRFDKYCGAADLLVLNDHKVWVWRKMEVPDLMPCTNDGRAHYQFFAAGQDNHVMMINVDNKFTWWFDTSRRSWYRME
jgi:hypothetical protein